MDLPLVSAYKKLANTVASNIWVAIWSVQYVYCLYYDIARPWLRCFVCPQNQLFFYPLKGIKKLKEFLREVSTEALLLSATNSLDHGSIGLPQELK